MPHYTPHTTLLTIFFQLFLWGFGTTSTVIVGILKNIYYANKRRQARNARLQTAQTKSVTDTAKKAKQVPTIIPHTDHTRMHAQSEFLKSLMMLVRIGFPSPFAKTTLHLLGYTGMSSHAFTHHNKPHPSHITSNVTRNATTRTCT